MSTSSTRGTASRWATLAVFGPGLLVALGAAAATAHGLFEVAEAAGVPAGIAWIYPLITDGLAIVAYAATSRLDPAGRRYAWAVVILAAGLSGLAQAAYLAGGLATPAAPTPGGVAEAAPSAGGWLRFGVGAWPAIAAAIVAHLLFMLATEGGDSEAESVPGEVSETVRADPERAEASTRAVARLSVQAPDVQPRSIQASAVQPPALNASEAAGSAERTTTEPETVQTGEAATAPERPAKPERSTAPASSPKRDRARAEARKHQARTGSLPTVDELMTLAEVSRGTAGTALQELRQQPAPLHVITELNTHQANS